MVTVLHQVCLCNENVDIAVFRSWDFFIVHHFVPEYNERFGIRVNTQTIFMFPYILDTYDVFHV